MKMHNLPNPCLSVQNCRRDERAFFALPSVPDHAIGLRSTSYGNVGKNADRQVPAPTLAWSLHEGSECRVLIVNPPGDMHMDIVLAEQVAEPINVILAYQFASFVLNIPDGKDIAMSCVIHLLRSLMPHSPIKQFCRAEARQKALD